MNIKDLTGQKFGKLTVIRLDGRDAHGNARWLCKCDCGNEAHRHPSGLKKVVVPSCGCYNQGAIASRARHDAFRDTIIGKQFGRLTVMSLVEVSVDKTIYLCRCSCGNTKEVSYRSMSSGFTSSCGCLAVETVSTHGLSNHRLYTIWENMIQRCYNSNNNNFVHYGERGISICDQWRFDFKSFYDWAVSNGYLEGLTIERKNNNLNYSPDNCYWATMTEQSRNKRTTVLSESDVRNIRSNSRPPLEIAEQYNTTPSYISSIKNNRVWKDV